ncbi:hypothetical protein BD560DRAFT_454819 [Blakeslea trispora]|nr:hypothetical protein BD560DRAFT_454819 [Blakeslea trispora]
MSTYRLFSQKVLSKVKTAKLTEADVKPQRVFNEAKGKAFWRPAQVSRRVQNDLRKACIQQGIEPSSIGLLNPSTKKPIRTRPNKLEKHERLRGEREQTIKRNLEKMPQTIQAWKEDKLKELAKQKTSMPF